MDIKAEFFLSCENAFVDKDQKMSVIGIFDGITCESLPVTIPQIVFAFNVKFKLDKPDTLLVPRLTLLTPSGEDMLEENQEWGHLGTKPQIKEYQNTGGRFTVATTAFEQAGTYTANLFVNGKKLATREFKITLKKKVGAK